MPMIDQPMRFSPTLASYLPRYQVRLITEGRRSGQDLFSESRHAAILLLDISGFTLLTERFTRQGARGAEQLAGILNRHCGRIAEITESCGGDIIAFAGDSALAMWPCEESLLAASISKAIQAASKVQSELDGYQPHPGVTIRQRSGIACGAVNIMELGGVGGRWQFLVAGDAIVEASLANQGAEPGQVLLSPAARNLVKDDAESPVPIDEGPHVTAVRTHPAECPGIEATTSEPQECFLPDLAPYVPKAISYRLQAGQEEWIAEFRNLSMMFLDLSKCRTDTNANVASLHQTLCCIQETLERFEGTLYQFLMDDKGLSAVCAFGLPPLAHENDPRRAVEAAIVIREKLISQNIAISAGITTGTVFCGVYGSTTRRQYTVLGNAVNLAARLMQAAKGSIWCDEMTRMSASSAALHFEPLVAILLKGRSSPIPVFSPLLHPDSARDISPVMSRPSSQIPVPIGRETELDFLMQAQARLADCGEGGCIFVEGEAGIGKSCLLDHFFEHVKNSSANRVNVWRAVADPIQHSTPYHAWRTIFRDALGLSGTSAVDQRQQVLAKLESAPSSLPLAPLLNLVLPLNFSESDATAALEGQARAENTQQLLLAILKLTAKQLPIVLILEDVHWFDASSMRLALLILQQIPGLLLVLSSRPLPEQKPLEFSELLSLPATRRVTLGVLESDLASRMVCRNLGVSRLPAEVERVIEERAAGNPLFCQQLAYALLDNGLIEIVDGRCRLSELVSGASLDAALAAMRFPSTVEGVVTSRLDRMTPAQQLTVKIASIIGQNFDLELLADLYPLAESHSNLSDDLFQLEKLAMIQRAGNDSGLYAFKHALVWEAAYNSVPFARRRQLHQSAAEWYERRFESSLAPHFSLLAHHWSHAESLTKAVYYCAEAGKQSLRNHANPEAAHFFGEALRLDEKAESHNDPVSPETTRRRAEWELQLGKAYVNWSRYVEGRDHLERALSLQKQKVPANPATATAALIAEVSLQLLRRVIPPCTTLQQRDKREMLLESSRVFEALTEIYYLQDDPLRCLHAVFRSLNFAESAGDSPELARACSSVASLLGFLTLHRAAESYFSRSARVSQTIADPASAAWVALARAMYLTGVGQWDLAANLLNQAIAASDNIGDRRRGDDARITLTLVQLFQGRFQESLALANLLYRSAKERLDTRIQAEALHGKAWNLLQLGRTKDLPACVEELDQLRSAQMKIGGWHRKQDVNSLSASLHVMNGDFSSAAKCADEVTAATQGGSFQPNQILIHSAILEVRLALLQAARNRAQSRAISRWSAPSLEANVRLALKKLRSFSRVFPIGRPLLHLRQGQFEWIKGNRSKAARECELGLQVARNLNAYYYQGLAHLELTTYLDENNPARAQHRDQAKAILGRLGAVRDLTRLSDTSRTD